MGLFASGGPVWAQESDAPTESDAPSRSNAPTGFNRETQAGSTAGPAGDPGATSNPATSATPKASAHYRLGSDDLEISPEVVDRLSEAQLVEIIKSRDSVEAPIVAVAVPIAFFLTVVGTTALVLVFRHRREELRHETIRIALDKGMDLSPDLIYPARSVKSAFRRGVVLVAAGLGLMVILGTVDSEQGSWSLGFLPFLLGLAYLVVWRLEERSRTGGVETGSSRRYPLDLE